MVLSRRQLIERITKGVRPSFVIFAFLGAAVLAAAAWLSTPPDTIIAVMPGDVAVYIHENRTVPNKSFIRVPEGLTPPESAVIAVIDENLELTRFTVLSWHPDRPTETEREILAEAGAERIGSEIFALPTISPVPLVPGTKVPGTGDASLSLLPLARSLARLRSTFPLQGYINTNLIPPQALQDFLKPVKELGPAVFGAAMDDHHILAAAMPEPDAAKKLKFFGFGLPDGRVSRKADDAVLTLAGQTSFIDPLPVLFYPVEENKQLSDAPDSAEFAASQAALRRLLKGPQTISFWPDENPRIVGLFSHANPDLVVAAAERYINAAMPDSSIIDLPDKDTLLEFRHSKAFSAHPIMIDDASRPRLLEVESIGLKVVVAADGHGGTIIDSAENSQAGFPSLAVPNDCPSKGANDELSMNIPELIHLFLSTYFQHYPQVSRVLFTKYGDNGFFACGY